MDSSWSEQRRERFDSSCDHKQSNQVTMEIERSSHAERENIDWREMKQETEAMPKANQLHPWIKRTDIRHSMS